MGDITTNTTSFSSQKEHVLIILPMPEPTALVHMLRDKYPDVDISYISQPVESAATLDHDDPFSQGEWLCLLYVGCWAYTWVGRAWPG